MFQLENSNGHFYVQAADIVNRNPRLCAELKYWVKAVKYRDL